MVLRTNKNLFGVSSAGGKITVVGDGGIILSSVGPDIPVSVRLPEESLVPTSIMLHQNYPNPFNPTTVISYQLSVVSDVRLSVYDVLGHEMAVLVNEARPAGMYRLTWDASHFPSGMYLCRLIAGSSIITRKLLLVK
ncbi:MAG TPA: T9SS type A sorting domain-containing protein, partial [Bacteroidota bacterium]|nr:T9SS type A sorting domain-containing protein [Bacteroidota bacterium]